MCVYYTGRARKINESNCLSIDKRDNIVPVANWRGCKLTRDEKKVDIRFDVTGEKEFGLKLFCFLLVLFFVDLFCKKLMDEI